MRVFRVLLMLFFLTYGSTAFARCVALTFDDGPHPVHTRSILKVLKEEGVAATFFVVGKNVERHPDILFETAAARHEIGNHMYKHDWLSKLSPEKVNEMIAKNDVIIKAIIGREPYVLRAPFFAESEEVRAAQAARGRPFVQADVDPRDFDGRSASRVTDYVLRNVKGGSIVLLHDIMGQTALAVLPIVRGLKARGYELVTVSQLLSRRCGEIRARVRSAASH